jgi:hypothetical protein
MQAIATPTMSKHPLAFSARGQRSVLKRFDGVSLTAADLAALGERTQNQTGPAVAGSATRTAYRRLTTIFSELRRQQQGLAPQAPVGPLGAPHNLRDKNILLPRITALSTILWRSTGDTPDTATSESTLRQAGMTLKWLEPLKGLVCIPSGSILWKPGTFSLIPGTKYPPIMSTAHMGPIQKQDIWLRQLALWIRDQRSRQGTETPIPIIPKALAEKGFFTTIPLSGMQVALQQFAFLGLVDMPSYGQWRTVPGDDGAPEKVFQPEFFSMPSAPRNVQALTTKLFGRYPKKSRELGGLLGKTLRRNARREHPAKFPTPAARFMRRLLRTYLPNGTAQSVEFSVEDASPVTKKDAQVVRKRLLDFRKGTVTGSTLPDTGNTLLAPGVELHWRTETDRNNRILYQLRRVSPTTATPGPETH